MKIQKTKYGQYFITLPSVVMKALGWKKKDVVILKINNKTLSLSKK